MAQKRKISIRKTLQVLLTAVVGTCCAIAIVSASRIEGSLSLKGEPQVHISNNRKYHFIDQKEIMDLAINNRNVDVKNTPVSKLDVRGIERAIMADPWVADAQVYIDIDRVMHMYVTQRVPIARLFRENGDSYYMDSSLHTMPLSESHTYYTMVVTNVPDVANDTARKALMKKISTIVNAIRMDSFWNAQVSHVVVDSAGEFELIPVLGEQKIRFGDTSRAKEKLANLVAFYRNVLNRIGWDKYQTLDVRFKGQVVASPALFKEDDPTFKRMSWVASIKAAQEQSHLTDSVRTAARVAAQSAAERLTQAAVAQQAALKKEKKDKKNKSKDPKEKKVVGKGKEVLENLKNSLRGKGKETKGRTAKEKDKKATAKKEDAKAVATKKPAAKEAATKQNAKPHQAPAAAKKTTPHNAATAKKAAKAQAKTKEKEKDKKNKDKGNDKTKKQGAAKYSYPDQHKGH
ncbi:hypothetical protein GCM10023093_21100 [Nemorincola caseinilytica]|uniref:Cell division protein FtsQ n=1 Tax=Nemorincola caseinilytica TaxID=2054315 RepID=A0ABP8NJW2_9BACT